MNIFIPCSHFLLWCLICDFTFDFQRHTAKWTRSRLDTCQHLMVLVTAHIYLTHILNGTIDHNSYLLQFNCREGHDLLFGVHWIGHCPNLGERHRCSYMAEAAQRSLPRSRVAIGRSPTLPLPCKPTLSFPVVIVVAIGTVAHRGQSHLYKTYSKKVIFKFKAPELHSKSIPAVHLYWIMDRPNRLLFIEFNTLGRPLI